MRHDDKRQLRKLKREIKRLGNKRRRRHLKRELEERPDDAPSTEFDFDRCSSATMNKLDNDATRKKNREENRARQ